MYNLEVTEIFHSIQGESVYSGMPCTFIRLAGCNLRCSYCDTVYSHEKGEIFGFEEILEKIVHYRCRLVELTGGEHLMQKNTPEFAEFLLSKNYKVLVETNGSLDIDLVSSKCSRIVDVKCPSSGMSDRNDFSNMKKLTHEDQLKFVVSGIKDLEYMRDIINKYRPELPEGSILVSPVAGTFSPPDLAGWILDSGMTVRMQIQLHRIIWPDIDRGV